MLPSSKFFFITVVLILYSNNFVYAQIDLSKYQVGLSAGNFIYQGDLTPDRFGSFKTTKPQIAVHVYRVFNDAFSLRFNVTKGALYGNDALYAMPAWRRDRNFKFTTPVTELSIHGVWNFLGNNNSKFSPYVFAGAGVAIVNIKRDWSNLNTTVFGDNSVVQTGLAIDAAKKLPKIIPVLPVGVGVNYFISNRFLAIAEINYRVMHTDYLDGFSQAANPKSNDYYYSSSVGLVYSFLKLNGKILKCPKKVL